MRGVVEIRIIRSGSVAQHKEMVCCVEVEWCIVWHEGMSDCPK